jgi:hypothetical protein
MSSTMLTAENSLFIVRGASKTLQMTILNEDGTPVNLTDCRILLTVKAKITDGLPLIQKDTSQVDQIEITNARYGIAQVYFVPADTASLDTIEYIYDVWLILPTLRRFPVIPPAPFVVNPSVTVIPL